VIAALPAGVLDTTDVRERVRGLVQQRDEHVDGAALEAFAGDEQLGQPAILPGRPSRGREVPEAQPAAPAPGAGTGDDHDRRQLAMTIPDV